MQRENEAIQKIHSLADFTILGPTPIGRDKEQRPSAEIPFRLSDRRFGA